MNEPTWINPSALLMLQQRTIAEHGGSPGIRDEGLLDSALARPRNLFAYNAEADIAELAAAYGYGLAKNHAFIDGNKRIAFIATYLFLELNGYVVMAKQIEQIRTMLALAASEISDADFAGWIRSHLKRRD